SVQPEADVLKRSERTSEQLLIRTVVPACIAGQEPPRKGISEFAVLNADVHLVSCRTILRKSSYQRGALIMHAPVMRFVQWTLLTVIFGVLCCGRLLAAGIDADWVLYNGKILTADTDDPGRFSTAQAVAIYDGKFIVVGQNQEALATAGAKTKKIDLQ